MVKSKINHNNSNQYSQQCCDSLLEYLQAKQPGISVKIKDAECAFSYKSKAFAHFYHYKKDSTDIKIYFSPKPDSIAELPAKFFYKKRSQSKKGWGKSFPHYFTIKSLEDVEEAANFLFDIAEANKKQISKKKETTINNTLNLFPNEIDSEATLREGAKHQVIVNAYERNEKARKKCIKIHGTSCFICGFLFGNVYGEIAENFIHVHHLRPLSELGAEYIVDPVKDLCPVCPNCHAVLHLRKPAFSIQEVKDMLQKKQSIKK